MRGFFLAVFAGLLSWWGLVLIAALDSSMVFFLPFAVDIAVVILVSRYRELFWLYPILAAAGSLCGAMVTYYVGGRIGEAGLERYVSGKRLPDFRRRIEEKGAVALAALNLLPPPFPFTACILVAGALQVNTWLFFTTLFVTRLLRFGGEGVLAYFYGRRIIRWLRSETVEYLGIALFAIAVIGTIIGTIQLVRKKRALQCPPSPRRAA